MQNYPDKLDHQFWQTRQSHSPYTEPGVDACYECGNNYEA